VLTHLQDASFHAKRGLEEMTRVLELDPGNRDALARLREIKQDMKGSHGFVPAVGEAQQKYREGLKLYGDERYAEAKTAFEEALRLNPKDTDARQALDHLLDELASPSPTAAANRRDAIYRVCTRHNARPRHKETL
jgi:tetratricopeptide (TPR) repeat protein